MKKLALTLFLCSLPAYGAATFVQSKSAAPAATSGTLAYNSNITNGNLLVVIYHGSNITAPTTPTDTLGTTFFLVDGRSGLAVAYSYFFYVGVASSGGADTVSFAGVQSNLTQVGIEEWSGATEVAWSAWCQYALSSATPFVCLTTGGSSSPIALTATTGVIISLVGDLQFTTTFTSLTGGTIRNCNNITGGSTGTLCIGDFPATQATNLSVTNAATWSMSSGSAGGGMANMFLGPNANSGVKPFNGAFAQ